MKLNGIVLSCTALVLIGTGPALAGLGGSLDPVAADQAHIKGTWRVTSNAAYAVHEVSTNYGTAVREYTNADGKVFAVAWNGPSNPDLQQLLGSYYTQYLQAPVAHKNHRQLLIEQPDLVIQNSGHARAFAGRAWVPSLLPPTVSAVDIR